MLMRFSIVFILVVSLQACFETPQKLTTVKHVKLPVNMPINATFSQNGKMLALLTLTELSLWQTENHTLLAHYKLPKQDNLMRFMAMSETANRLVVADSSTVYLFKLSDLTPLTDWPVSGFSRDAKITAINLSDDGLHVFVGLNEGSLLHVNLRARQQSLYQLHQSDIRYIAPKLIEST